jgi:hypothetical protein
MNEQTEEILEDCFGNFCSQCVKDAECTKAAHGIGCNDRIKPLKYKCTTCMSYHGCTVAWKTPLPCLDFKDYPEGVYNGDNVISKEPRIGEPEDHAMVRQWFNDVQTIRVLIREKHPIGKEFVEGTMECPICKTGERFYMISDHVNGHIHSHCSNKKCANWME